MSLLIFSACLVKIASNLVKDSCVTLISVCSCVLFGVNVGVSIVFLVVCAYVIIGRLSVFCGVEGISFSCLGVFVI